MAPKVQYNRAKRLLMASLRFIMSVMLNAVKHRYHSSK